MKRVLFVGLAVAGITAALLTGLGIRAGKSVAAAPSTLTVAESVAPDTFDPQASDLNHTWYAWQLSYQCLLAAQPDGSVKPELATSYTVSKNGRRYVFTLRNGVHFQNGSLLTPADVIFTFQRLLKTADPYYKSRFASVASIQALGANKVVFSLKRRDAGFLLNMGDPFTAGCAILSQAAATSSKPALKMVGTGPFEMTNYSPNKELDFVRFDGYWGTKPSYQNLKILYIPELSAELAALQAGQVDLMFPDAQTYEALKQDGNVGIQQSLSGITMIVDVNHTVRPLNNIFVRRAISVAFDRSGVVSGALLGYGKPATYIPSYYPWAPSVKSVPYETHNVALAKQLLAKAGYPHGLTLHMMTIGGYADYADRFVLIAKSQLAKAGIKLVIDTYDSATWLSKLLHKKYELSWDEYSYFADPLWYVKIRPYLTPILPPLPKLFAAAESATSLDAYHQRIVQIVKTEGSLVTAVIPLANFDKWVAYNKARVSNVHVNPSLSRTFLFDVNLVS